jgi:S-adenosylmethionine:tRNA ribosyltransferase-isomerase
LCYHYNVLVEEFDYDLPLHLIAQQPLAARDASRMLVFERDSGRYQDSNFRDFPQLLRGDELLVVNNARVIPARLFAHRFGLQAEGVKQGSQRVLPARIEVLLIRHVEGDVWEALVRPGRKVGTGERLKFEAEELQADVLGRGPYGLRQLRFFGVADVQAAIERIGHVPLPPYIRRADEPADRERYQTVFATRPGSVAAPTAGLHFTPRILAGIHARGVQICELTLDVGLGTFQPIHARNLEEHAMHREAYEIPASTAAALREAHLARRPILAIGTTVVRSLEDAAQKAVARGNPPCAVASGRAAAEIFIRPGHQFALVKQLLTNFHLPRSTLLVLVAAFAGRQPLLSAYQHAVQAGYRFYSYGDCMLIR